MCSGVQRDAAERLPREQVLRPGGEMQQTAIKAQLLAVAKRLFECIVSNRV
jgi:hypothetical protein